MEFIWTNKKSRHLRQAAIRSTPFRLWRNDRAATAVHKPIKDEWTRTSCRIAIQLQTVWVTEQILIALNTERNMIATFYIFCALKIDSYDHLCVLYIRATKICKSPPSWTLLNQICNVFRKYNLFLKIKSYHPQAPRFTTSRSKNE